MIPKIAEYDLFITKSLLVDMNAMNRALKSAFVRYFLYCGVTKQD